MIRRIEGTAEIFQRIKNEKDNIGLVGFRRTPTRPIDEQYLPCVFMIEGNDEVIKNNSRNMVGYPSTRALEIALEIVATKDSDIFQLYRDVRSAVFVDNNPVLADGGTFVREIRTEGPSGYGLPDVIGMTLVLEMSYKDEGN